MSKEQGTPAVPAGKTVDNASDAGRSVHGLVDGLGRIAAWSEAHPAFIMGRRESGLLGTDAFRTKGVCPQDGCATPGM